MDWLLQHYDELFALVGALLTVATIITKLTPTPKDDEILLQIVNWFSILKPKDSKGLFKAPCTKVKDE